MWLACLKCKKQFPGDVANGFNYSGYNMSLWSERTHAQHKVHAKAAHVATTPTAQKELKSKYGLQYSVLFELPYFDAIHQHIIDPMHNLYLGLARCAMKT